jgi:hypothetical protein
MSGECGPSLARSVRDDDGDQLAVLHRALPATMIDLIRDGVPAKALKERGDRAVWRALAKTASSAVQRGWDRADWEALVIEPRSNLGSQLRGGRRTKTPAESHKTLTSAWETAERWVQQAPPGIRA